MRKFQIVVNGTAYIVDVEEIAAGAMPAAPVYQAPVAAPAPVQAPVAAPAPVAAAPAPVPSAPVGAEVIKCPMPGTIMKVNVSAGQSVKRGDVLLILEAMKMENEIMAPRDGVVASVNVQSGAAVNSGDVLVSLS